MVENKLQATDSGIEIGLGIAELLFDLACNRNFPVSQGRSITIDRGITGNLKHPGNKAIALLHGQGSLESQNYM